MQLWKKNFLVSFFMFLMIVNLSLLLLLNTGFKKDLENRISNSLRNVQQLEYTLKWLADTENMPEQLRYIGHSYYNSDIYIDLGTNEKTFVSYLPEGVEFSGNTDIVTYRNEKYTVICKETDTNISIVYMEKIQDLYQSQNRKRLIFFMTGLLSAAAVGGLLYLTMKKIYMPVNNIAHELRNSLTVLQGYGQYIQLGNITEEDRFFAAEQIMKETRCLKETSDRLLVMGNLRDGTIKYTKIDMPRLLSELNDLYPIIIVENHTDTIEGDPSLIRCLLKNLISNAVNAGEHVTVTASSNCIVIWNDGKYIDHDKLKYLTRNHEYPRASAERNGYGIGLCYEIVKLHGWRLRYESSAVKGTTVTIKL